MPDTETSPFLLHNTQGYVQMRSGNSGVSSSRLNTAIAGACVLFVTNLLAALIIELDSAAGSDEITVAAPSAKGVRVLLWCWCCFNACINRPRLSPSCRCQRPPRPLLRPCKYNGHVSVRGAVTYMYSSDRHCDYKQHHCPLCAMHSSLVTPQTSHRTPNTTPKHLQYDPKIARSLRLSPCVACAFANNAPCQHTGDLELSSLPRLFSRPDRVLVYTAIRLVQINMAKKVIAMPWQ